MHSALVDRWRARRYNRRFQGVAADWPLERLLPLTDLDLDVSERGEFTDGIHQWRLLVGHYLVRFGVAPGHVYCFGCAHGDTVTHLVDGFRNRRLDLPFMHFFDSFEGLPEEAAGLDRPPVWAAGAFSNAQDAFQQIVDGLDLPADGYRVHPGWFRETLRPALVEEGVFKPAVYVDIDADLFVSTVDALDFLLHHRLIVPGTLIGYDDWGDTELWTAGESLAHKLMCERYGMRCAQLVSWGERPLIRKLFLVIDVRR